ncbi:uncharacterized protein OCT59_014291 [Rhizophagus irregularis]|uniref:Uncharacterized protein n=1 Tax=Rhizophagus irregularis (strain DAOM 181602 / DAOM 197198 / MUCL 43194) TaxID=747089 RepID=A0A2H5TQC0_RHIID|nr:hypothetical protein GLOIN_2v1884347 [Rhizophagus irregularis DAOM 181602=DAOM 197198]POG60416.1 hypothetical protein GLOIN_2v1884347 [Rhizophagus irregularis DAOM 181602=DAOM 197198]UZO21909.1 hypothetical protein OCT59_014291 [Rhizophagus irregularis]GBC44730.1 hypothetical protein GLOIN_2v1884347 [Rhizophagus irregularis DAOM 181602=DAOM 197198]|eukprot:XP_025167282.1 hypothetical protein GLOIN_2v1884347 [Rhizophagus irregularis DAOM 181602=DAOM 197198]
MQITSCPGCSLHCLDMDKGPLALKTVSSKLIHRSCLSVLPFYRCLQLYQMTIHIDISQQFINLKLSPFILCSYFRFLLGFSELYIPERYLALTQPPLMHCDTSPALLPDLTPILSPAFALRPDTKFHLSGTIHVVDSLTSLLVCAWIQTLDDFILDSGIFSCPMISPYNDVAELAFVLYVLNSFPLDTSVSFVSLFKFNESFPKWCEVSPVRRVRLKNNSLWFCISELLKSKRISCSFSSFLKDSISAPSIRAYNLIKGSNWHNLLQPIPLMDDVFPSFLKTMGLFTGHDELLTQDPIKYWQGFTDICHFFSLIGLSQFLPLQSTFHSVDWSLSFETFKQTLYQNLAVSKSSIFTQFRLKLWFNELPIMYKLFQRFPGLYADDSLCPICGIFMEILEYLFICSPDYLDIDEDHSMLPIHKDVTTNLIKRFLVKLATKVSSSPGCKQTYDELLAALRNLPSLGLPDLLSNNNHSSFLHLGFSEVSFHVTF